MNQLTYQWAVVGAGPAGIAAVGRLIDEGIAPSDIVWIDPLFTVGDLGQYWSNVSSNTTVQRFLDFLHASSAFDYAKRACNFSIDALPTDETCLLKEIVAPLQWVTNHLREQVVSVEASVKKLAMNQRQWQLTLYAQSTAALSILYASNVILATGAIPSQLNYPETKTLPLSIAIDPAKLSETIKPDETIAVFGSSHSAMIVIRNLVEFNSQKVINFYRSPCRYAIDQGDWILFDNTGLKGDTARWTRAHIDGVLPANVERHLVNDASITTHLPRCDWAVYAVGFTARHDFQLVGYSTLGHDPHHGIIGPGLFGLGIGFPGVATDPFGAVEAQIGLWKFMVYLNKVLPVWMQYSA